jgi:hypothetical protein
MDEAYPPRQSTRRPAASNLVDAECDAQEEPPGAGKLTSTWNRSRFPDALAYLTVAVGWTLAKVLPPAPAAARTTRVSVVAEAIAAFARGGTRTCRRI